MPININSIEKKAKFLTELQQAGIPLTEIPKKRGTIYQVNKHKVYLRTTTKEDAKIWYDIPKIILEQVDFLIYQTTSKNNFTLFPVDFFEKNYENFKNSNKKNIKIFYIDWNNDDGEKIISGDFTIDIKEFCCSTSQQFQYGNYDILKNA